MASVTISAKDRDLLYERLVVHLGGIDSLYLAVKGEDFTTADRVGHELADELRLLMDDLGWGKHPGDDPVSLKSSPQLLRRVLQRIREEAEDMEAAIEVREAEQKNRELLTMCKKLLAELDSQGR